MKFKILFLLDNYNGYINGYKVVKSNKNILYYRKYTKNIVIGIGQIKEYKQRIENLFKKSYYNLTYIGENYDDVSIAKPSKIEIEEYRQLKSEGKTGTNRFKELRQKLSNWKVLDSMVDEENNSVAN